MTFCTLFALFLVLAVVVLADVWLHNPAPYLFNSDKTKLTYFEWFAQQHALAWFWSGRPVWDAPVWLRVVWMAAVVFFMLWKRPAAWLRDWLSKHREPTCPHLPFWLILIVSAAVLWTFRSQDLRYGNSLFLTRLIPREVKSMGANIDYEQILDCTLHCRAYYHLHRLFGMNIVQVFSVLGVGATLIGLAIVWPFWRRRVGLPAATVLLLWFSAGWSQMFFGHVENLTSVAVVLLIYAALALDHLEREDGPPFWVCSFTAALAGCFHLLAGLVWPTLGVLLWHDVRHRGHRFGPLFGRGVLAFILPLVASVEIATLYGFPPAAFKGTHLAHLKFVFLLTPENAAAHRALYQYPFLSFPQLRDMFNELVLVTWPGLVLVAGLFIAARRERLWRRPTVQFWIVATVLLQIFIVIWNPDLGYIRDWDMFSAVAFGWTGLGIELLVQLNRQKNSDRGEESAFESTDEPHSDWSLLLARVLLFALATSLPMRIFQVLHHSWWVGPANIPGMF